MGFSPTKISRDIFSSPPRFLLWLALFGAFAAACAISVAPSGGPEDRTPPRVTATVPSMGSTGVDPGTAIKIAFSEPVQRDGFIRQVDISPTVQIARIRWKGNTAEVLMREPLHPDTTYVVRLKSGYRDQRNVASTSGFEFAFATSAQMDTGRVDGTVYFRREPSKHAVVAAFLLPRDSGFAPEISPADRIAETSELGDY